MRCIFAGLMLLLLPAFAAAQRPSSRFVPIEFDGDPEAILAQQLLRIRGHEQLQALRDNRIDLKKLLESLKESGDLPKWLADPEIKKNVEALPDAMKTELLKDLKQQAEQQQSDSGAAPVPQPQAPPAIPAKPAPRFEPQENLDERALRWLKERMDNIDGSKLADMLRESPAWGDALRDLRTALENRDGRPGGLGQWAERWLPDTSRVLGGLKLPDVPSLPRVSLNWQLPQIQAPGLPNLGAPALPGAGFFTALQWALWAILAIGVAMTCVYLWRRRQVAALHDKSGWRLGPWPLDPARIATADELTAAFDYLALWRFGANAQPWNHRTLAQRLAPPDEALPTRQAAHQLAALYEQARYAPNVVLAPDALATARRHLCFLAGRSVS